MLVRESARREGDTEGGRDAAQTSLLHEHRKQQHIKFQSRNQQWKVVRTRTKFNYSSSSGGKAGACAKTHWRKLLRWKTWRSRLTNRGEGRWERVVSQ